MHKVLSLNAAADFFVQFPHFFFTVRSAMPHTHCRSVQLVKMYNILILLNIYCFGGSPAPFLHRSTLLHPYNTTEENFMLKSFRMLSLFEGLSLLTLLFIAMPAKYQLGYDFVWQVGMTHGILWLTYVVLSLLVSHKQSWSVMFWMLVLVCSVIPFAFVFLDGRLKSELVLARA
jgi:integral membrane protein